MSNNGGDVRTRKRRPTTALGRGLPQLVWLVVLLAAMLVVPGLVGAQDDPPEPEPPVSQDEGVETGELEQEEDGIAGILRAEEEMLVGIGYTYDPGSRRDPFRSLLAASDRPALIGPRPEGIPGLLIDEITLTGIFIMPDGPVAQIQSSDKDKSYLLRVGDQLYDGDVVAISQGEAAFKQIVDDPTALKPFREVVKKLNP